MNDPEISVVIPAYRCEKFVDELYSRLIITFEKLKVSFEIIFVNDSSPENDWEAIKALAEKDGRVKGLNFSRNFGQHCAITAGLEASKGNWTVIMDCDLQDRPEEIEKLYAKTQEGYDIVYARRAVRKDSFLKRMSSKYFYKVLSYLTEIEQDETVGNFGIYSRKSIDAVISLRENLRYFPVKIRWVGFRSATVSVEHSANRERKSSYNFRRLFGLAFDVMLATSNKPLKLVVKLGMLISALAFVFAVYLFVRALSGDYLIAGWPSLIVSIWFLSGIIILTLGIIGLYLGKVFDEVKNKPLYIIKERTDDND
ncbi:MAG TPA: glycosyltransferase family 2 protein [Clostridiales bacterium]|nr:glycosyltransferase family 2 protein [Clostridiales bacterium]HQP70996.1 glycosyltransferase family 2 protein [Clostridiales bacterium]